LNTALEASVAAVVTGLEYFLVLRVVVLTRLGFDVDPRTSALFLTVDVLVTAGFIFKV